jgi:predicted RNase H-like HicB family nuclease
VKFLVTLEKDEDGYYVTECPSLPGCLSQGKTPEEALTNIREAIEGILDLRRRKGLPVPAVEVSEIEIAV